MRKIASNIRITLAVLLSICLLGSQSSLAQDKRLVVRK